MYGPSKSQFAEIFDNFLVNKLLSGLNFFLEQINSLLVVEGGSFELGVNNLFFEELENVFEITFLYAVEYTFVSP